jgi:hypothetical protein
MISCDRREDEDLQQVSNGRGWARRSGACADQWRIRWSLRMAAANAFVSGSDRTQRKSVGASCNSKN